MTDKVKRRVREHAKKHGLSYQAAWNQLEGSNERKSYEFWEWLDHMNGPGKSDCLTVAQVIQMKKGEQAPLLIMHRNLCDHVYPRHPEFLKQKQPAEEFFELLRDGAMYTHGEGLSGTITWGWDKKLKLENDPFYFHIEYAPNRWFPVNEEGCLPAEDPQKFASFSYSEPKHWSTFPKSTRVGWRGPSLLWKHLAKQPQVFTKIDMDRVAAQMAAPVIEQLFGIDPQNIYLERAHEEWLLIIDGLTEERKEEISERFKDLNVVSREEWRSSFEKTGVGTA